MAEFLDRTDSLYFAQTMWVEPEAFSIRGLTAFITQPLEQSNTLIQSYHGGAGLDILGGILVVKTDLRGAVQNVVPGDFLYIERMLIEWVDLA